MSKKSNPPNVTRSIKNCKGLTRIPKSEEEQIMGWLQNDTPKNLNQRVIRRVYITGGSVIRYREEVLYKVQGLENFSCINFIAYFSEVFYQNRIKAMKSHR